MWRVVGASVIGTSHRRNELPCQDHTEFLRCEIGGEPALIIAIADGAGSAAQSEIGAKEAVGFLLQRAASFNGCIENIDRVVVNSWYSEMRKHLAIVAERSAVTTDDLACTGLLAVMGERNAVFAQVGDGAWIADRNGVLEALTWPFKGEFANETVFITSPQTDNHIQFVEIKEPLTTVAGFSDGLELLALDFQRRNVHTPFFTKMFSGLQRCDDETNLMSPLIEFLSSERVNGIVDDDKTLVLACRVDKTHQGVNELDR